ncbi:hypothetical protein QAD02_021459 [Eretmocerus hayati]|uniref:Uncharacterized protein n=1 Tax=Eretmocerus hayati TaxID=131215 RepID=A0ACC2PRS7_9HYME|nr:hypothetical protein QAD02_021459 [Eretmocerus hayati]
MELNDVQDLQIEKEIRKNHKTLTSFEEEKLGSDDPCSTEVIDTVQSSTNALHSTLGVSVANEFNAQMDSSHVRNHELTTEQSHPVSMEYTSGDDANQNIDILRRAPIFKRKITICHPQTKVEHTQRSEHISQINHESEEQLPTEGLPNSHNFEPVHNLSSDPPLIGTIDDQWSNKPPSPHMPPGSQSSSAIDARNYATDGSKSEECTANEHIHEDTTKTCRPTHLKRKIEMDGKELPPTKMCSGPDHNLETISADKWVGLKR